MSFLCTFKMEALLRSVPRTLAVALLSFPLMLLAFALGALALRPRTDEQRKLHERRLSWILTSLASVSMTGCSLPFVWDLLRTLDRKEGFDVERIQGRRALATTSTGIFLAYLAADLLVSRLFYPKLFTLLTGWVHHTAYFCLLTYLSIWREHWLKVFATCGLLEFPTLLLSLQNLFSSCHGWSSTLRLLPFARSPKLLVDFDLLFTSSFFATRIVFHAVLIALYSSGYGRAIMESSQPAVFLALAMVLHVFWFKSAVQRLVRRRTRRASALRAEASKPAASAASQAPDKTCVHSQTSYVSSRAPRISVPASTWRPVSPRFLLRASSANGTLPRSNRFHRFSSRAAAAARRFPFVGSRIEGLDTWHSLLVPDREDSLRRRVFSSIQRASRASAMPAVPSILLPPRSLSSSPEGLPKANYAAAAVLRSLGREEEQGRRHHFAQGTPGKTTTVATSLSPGSMEKLSHASRQSGRPTSAHGRPASIGRSTPVGSVKVRRSRHASPAFG